MKIFNHLIVLLLLISFRSFSQTQSDKIELNGVVIDKSNLPIPYAAIGIPEKYIGTASTEEGTFYLQLSKNNFSDSLEISSIGYKTFKIKVIDYLKRNDKTILLEEDVVSLNEVNILSPSEYVKLAMKNLKNNTVSKTHQLNVLYRRFSSEGGRARLLIEHYLNVLDNGPASGDYSGIEVVTGRKSADYRFINKTFSKHPMDITANKNPLRTGFRLKDYKWVRQGDTSYDGEDIIIIEGREHKKDWRYIRLYIGMDKYGIYKVESSNLNSLFVYKKDASGKLHLSYHNRYRKGEVKLTDHQKKLLNTNEGIIKESYKHEIFVLGVQTDKKIINASSYNQLKGDMSITKFKYDPLFWKNFSLPPETEFYKKSVNELESIFGVPLETQFKLANTLNN